MLLYRVFPYLRGARPGSAGHPLYVHPVQGKGRWDNPARYLVRYLALSPEASIGESFGHLATWSPEMLVAPSLSGAERCVGVYRLDESTSPLLDLDDAHELVRRDLRPTDVVIRNRPRTQQIAAEIFTESRWAGIQWWPYQRPQWAVAALWATVPLTCEDVVAIPENPALDDAARTLAKHRRGI